MTTVRRVAIGAGLAGALFSAAFFVSRGTNRSAADSGQRATVPAPARDESRPAAAHEDRGPWRPPSFVTQQPVPRFGSDAKRADETIPGHQGRLRFMRGFKAFVKDSGVSPEQEASLRRLFAGIQAEYREGSDRVWKSSGPPTAETHMGARQAEEQLEARLQRELEKGLAEILTPAQLRQLRANVETYEGINRVIGLYFKPFES